MNAKFCFSRQNLSAFRRRRWLEVEGVYWLKTSFFSFESNFEVYTQYTWSGEKVKIGNGNCFHCLTFHLLFYFLNICISLKFASAVCCCIHMHTQCLSKIIVWMIHELNQQKKIKCKTRHIGLLFFFCFYLLFIFILLRTLLYLVILSRFNLYGYCVRCVNSFPQTSCFVTMLYGPSSLMT